VYAQLLSKDSVTVAVDAVVYYRISDATLSVVNVDDAKGSTQLLAQTTLRNVLGTKSLSEILSDRESISHVMQVTMATAPLDHSPTFTSNGLYFSSEAKYGGVYRT
jgi:erythrocyte band 7 integral membrane protein